jgi:hypothetical protein
MGGILAKYRSQWLVKSAHVNSYRRTRASLLSCRAVLRKLRLLDGLAQRELREDFQEVWPNGGLSLMVALT